MSGMPSNFQLSLELTNIFPAGSMIRHLEGSVYQQIMTLARDLRKSGPNILVEEHSAAIFGRARIEADIEDRFKALVLLDTTIIQLHGNSSLALSVGPGPTVGRAFASKDRFYLSTIIQLSLLGWVLCTSQTSSMI